MKTVDRGAALLDERMPGWEWKVDLERLDLESPCDCPLGQLHPDASWRGYVKGLEALNLSEAAARRHGFVTWRERTPWDADAGASWGRLTAAWRSAILERRGG